MTNYEQSLLTVREVFIEYPKRFAVLKEQLRVHEQEIMDLLHVVELTNFNASEGYKLAKELKIARQHRRQIKDEMEVLEPIINFLYDKKPVEKFINNTIGDLRNVVKRHDARTYRMRIRKDLQERVK